MTVEIEWEDAIANLGRLETSELVQIAIKILHILESRAEHPTKH